MIIMKPILLTQPGCKKCDWLKEQMPSENGIQIMDRTTPDGLAHAAYYELVDIDVPILVTEQEKVIEGAINIKNALVEGGHIIGQERTIH